MKKKGVILSVSKKLFAENGYDATCMDDIAKKSCVNKATIYYYFKSKNMLYQEVMKDSIKGVYEYIKEKFIDMDDAKDALRVYIDAFYLQSKKDEAFLRILLREIASNGKYFSKELAKSFIDVLKILETILKNGQEDGIFNKTDTKMVHFAIIGAISFYLCSFKIRERFKNELEELDSFKNTSESDLEELYKIILNGLERL